MGNGESQARDKRAFRKEHANIFEGVIFHYEKANNLQISKELVPAQFKDEAINVVVRLRPLFDHEEDKGEFPVVQCTYSSTSKILPKDNCVIVHKCMSGPDMKPQTAFIEHVAYPFPNGHVFCEDHTTQDVYSNAVLPLIGYTLNNQSKIEQRGTIFMYGQTGTGKTYTITGVVKLLSSDLFQYLLAAQKSERSTYSVKVTCLEMLGDSLYDLNNNHTEVKLLQGSGNVRDINVVGSTEININDADGLWKAYDDAAQLRETHATMINSQSSRSHYIFRISIERDGKKYARLTLIDLAGSERNADSMYHDADRQRESAWINSSLSNLKDVIRTVTLSKSNQQQHVPYRNSKLTQLLRDSFEGSGCKTLIISTLSPISTDTEHTMNTLQVMSLLANGDASLDPVISKTQAGDVFKSTDVGRMKPVAKWTTEECFAWIETVDKGKFAKYAEEFPKSVNGAQMFRFPAARFAQITGDQDVGIAMRKALDQYTEALNKQKQALAEETRSRLKGK
ncbi:kinesin family member [Acrasis kona]|uniref:Kinesin-like protein n=1 Tax=Acrasis kona TaxID=1008807 RepID=A0AAW2YU12_9EUKA